MQTSNKFPRMHVSLYVRDISKTVDFYSSFFNTRPAKVKKGYAKFELESPSLIISFVENPERVSGNFGHLGIQVETEEQLREKLTEVKAKGVEVLEEIGTNCCYALQDKFWVKDPDGVQWEVYYFHEDVEFNDPKYVGESVEACCMPEDRPEKKKVKLSELQAECVPGSGCC